MANQGQVKPGDMVYDPFVGTGSIAIACTHYGSTQFGSDLDIRVLKGYAVGRKSVNKIPGLDKYSRFDVFTNFIHYKFPMPNLFIMDCAKQSFQRGGIFDAIVCDPPYGVRARSKKVGISDTKMKRKARLEEEAKQ